MDFRRRLEKAAARGNVAGLLKHVVMPRELRDLVVCHGGWCLPFLARNHRWEHAPEFRERVEAATDVGRRAAGMLALATLGLSGVRYRECGYQASPHDELFTALANRRLAWTTDELIWLVEYSLTLAKGECAAIGLVKLPLSAAERASPAERAPVLPALHRFAELIGQETAWDPPVRRRTLSRLRALLPADETAIPPSILHDGDAYGRAAREAVVTAFGAPAAARVLRYLDGYGQGVRPKKTWLRGLADLKAAVPAAELARVLLTELLAHRESGEEHAWGGQAYRTWRFLHADTSPLLRAAVWLLADVGEPWVAPLLGDVAVHTGTGFGGSGADSRCAPVARAAVLVLAARAESEVDSTAAVTAQLTRCRAKIKNRPLAADVSAALEATAAVDGLTPAQLVERSVPDFGLDRRGHREVPVGEHVAVLDLAPVPKLVLRWRDAAGKERTTIPAVVKERHTDELAELRALAKEVKNVVASQRTRLEELMVTERTWTAADWFPCYAEHPVVGVFARSLIWEVRRDGEWLAGLPVDGGLRDHRETEIAVVADDEIRLWHPLRVPLAEVRSWRARFADLEFAQPFKQAFREIYLVTPAEEATSAYSNRFAAHILRYPQAHALMRTRGWVGGQLGYWNGGFDACAAKEFAETGWRASFSFELADENGGQYVPQLCATDQVRFERRDESGGWLPSTVDRVPALVFSEAMRDVDLFVGVTSIAADPTWVDGGVGGHRGYWERAAFGDLTESANVRREALQRLLPRTKIADRAELTDRFLVVHGRIRDYRIHLGSGNILMSPADTYLCIVPAHRPKAPGKVFLPFEGDGRLAVILSKAFLLAEDDAITDPSITRQLRAGLP
ncbi:DUF4132 domain-containing protein [Amycolatopsis sp. CA-230715]|uniref:DUF4132 domain-containing protein n=1 Tax=Amycolatopsis sp. CA-230715 TaxID=2745196 RepID=UPI001C013F5F|nr:DUF4132 domain-containing protein [Amycolatopsis sp. CA-230715]QWF81626.1 hypothetical protein HUW46_05059 [Amycolatopsis sp. CA-230715]